MDRNVEFKDLRTPMSRSLQFEALHIEAPKLHSARELVDDTTVGIADAEKDLTRKIVSTRSKNYSAGSKRRKPGNNGLAGSNKRKVIGDGSVKSSQPGPKKKKLDLGGSSVSSTWTPLNFKKPELHGNLALSVHNQESLDDDYDDSEPLINKITKNVAKCSQLAVNRTITASDSQLFSKNTKRVPDDSEMPVKTASWSDNLQIFSKPAKRAVKPRQIVTEFANSPRSIQSFIGRIAKSPRTPKRRKFKINNNNAADDSKLAIPSAEDEGEDAIALSDVLVPIKASKNAGNRGKLVTVSTTAQAQQSHSGDVQKTAPKRRVRKALTSQSHNAILNRTGDEQHSLEQNAARTLSSRFNSHSGVFGVGGSSAEQQPPEPVVSSSAFTLSQCDQISGLPVLEENKLSSTQSAGRVLRPRKQKQSSDRPKRCYEEVTLSETDAFRILNRRIKVFWPLDDKWYYGLVKSYDPTNKLHYVRYDDHDEEWLSLQNEKFKLQLLPGETAAAFNVASDNCGIRIGHFNGDGKHTKQVEPRFAEAIQSASQIPHQKKVSCENDCFTVENKFLEKSIAMPLDASFNSIKDGTGCVDCLSKYCMEEKMPGNNADCCLNNMSGTSAAFKDIDFNTGNAIVNSSSISDRRKSGNVYIRRRYHRRGNSPSGMDEGIRKAGVGKVSRLHKVDEPLKHAMPENELGSYIVHESISIQDFCAGENLGQSCGYDSHPVNSLRPKGKVEPEIIPTSITDTYFSNEKKLEDSQFGNDREPAKCLRSGKEMELETSSASFPGKEVSNAENMEHSVFGNDNELINSPSHQNKMGQQNFLTSITGKEFFNAQNLDYLRFGDKVELVKSPRCENKPGSGIIPASITKADFNDGESMEHSWFDTDSEPINSPMCKNKAGKEIIPASTTANSPRCKNKAGQEIIPSSTTAKNNLEHSQFGDDDDDVKSLAPKSKLGQDINAASSGKELSDGQGLEHSWIVNGFENCLVLKPKRGPQYGKDLISCHGLKLASFTNSEVEEACTLSAVQELVYSIHLKLLSYAPLTESSIQRCGRDVGNDIGSASIQDAIHSGCRLDATGEDQPVNSMEFSSFLQDLMISQIPIAHCVYYKERDGGDLSLPLNTFSPFFFSGTLLPNSWLYVNSALQQCGTAMSSMCDTKLDIVILDKMLGLRLFSFVGTFSDALNGVGIVLTSFSGFFENQYSPMSSRSKKPVDVQVPVSCIRVRLVSSKGVATPLDFSFHNFQEMTYAKWRAFKKLLKGLCFFYVKLPLTKCSTTNIGIFQSSSGHKSGGLFFQDSDMVVDDISTPSVSDGDVGFLNVLQDKNVGYADNKSISGLPLQKVICRDIFKLSSSVPRRNGSGILIESCQSVPPFLLSFAAAPSFFIALHLKLLLGKPIAPTGINICESELSELENGLDFNISDTGGCDKSAISTLVPTTEVSSKKVSQTIEGSIHCQLQTTERFLDVLVGSEDPTTGSNASAWLTGKISKVEVDASPVSTADGWVVSSPRSSYCELNVTGTAAGLTTKQDNHDSFVHGNVLKLRRCPTNRGSWRFAGSSRPQSIQGMSLPITEFEVDCVSPFREYGEGNAISTSRSLGHPVSSCIESNQLWSTETDSKPDQSTGSAVTLPSQGNFWDQEKFGTRSPSFGYRSQLWQDHGVQFFYSSFGEPRKRRSGYYNPFYSEGTDEVPFKSRGHVRRGRPSRQNKEEKSKKTIDSSSNLRLYLDSVSCSANVLVVGVDRGWRECGVQVVLESSNHNDWMLSVKISGLTKYTHKAQQIVQSGTTNRYTHAMIWKGGKDWSLEFPDRKQWALFKELHEECYNRNLRAASVRHIPIPGVHQIEDHDCSSEAFHFARPSSRYIRQVGGEVDMALDTSRVMYDMDSEDEEWLGHFNDSTGGDGGYGLNQVSEETFERVMDLLEKAAFTQQRELLTSDEVADFCLDIGPLEMVKAIHAYWQEKRWRKGMALVRQFQPASWERYQQQIKEWELQTNELQNLSTSNRQQLILEKPPMFAFCLKPRGLEVPNKTQKQRSHRKFSGGQHIVLREQESGMLSAMRRHNGLSIGDDASSDALGMMQYSSPPNEIHSQSGSLGAVRSEAACQLDFMDFTHKTCKQKHNIKSSRRKAKKMRIFVASKDPQRGGISHCNLDRRKQYPSHSWETSCGGQWNNNSSHRITKNNLSSKNSVYASGGFDFDAKIRVQEATNATRAASELAALKRAKAQRLFQKADLAVHKAVVAVVTAEAIQAAERDGQEVGQLDVEKAQSEHTHGETTSATKESLLPCLAHWWPASVDHFSLRDDATIGQSQCQSPSASLCPPSSLGSRMQGDIMPIRATAFRKDLDSKHSFSTGIEESLLPNEALLPVTSWNQEFDTGCGTTLF